MATQLWLKSPLNLVLNGLVINFVIKQRIAIIIIISQYFVCVEVLLPSQPNGVMSSAVSLPNHTFTGQALSSKRLTSIVHILSPETDNCPSWISGRERMTVENISWSISTKECCRPRRGLNPRPPGLQSDGYFTVNKHPKFWAKITLSAFIISFTLTLILLAAVHNPYFCKQCRSRSDGFWRSHLIRIYTVCHSVCEFERKHYMM